MHAITISEKRGHTLKQRGKGYLGELRGGKGKEPGDGL